MCRFLPTPGKSCITGIPTSARCSLGPIPERSSSWGLLIAPETDAASRLDNYVLSIFFTSRNNDLFGSVNRFLPAVVEQLYSVRLFPRGVDQYLGDGRVQQDGQVFPVLDRPEESSGRAHTRTVLVGRLSYSKSRVTDAVQISHVVSYKKK